MSVRFFVALCLLTAGVMLVESSEVCDPSANPTLKKDLNSTTPFQGTLWDFPNIIRKEDGTTFENISFVGRPLKTMWDHRVIPQDWIEVNAFVFNASFSDGKDVEVRVNPEFETEGKAEEQAKKYSEIIGRVPRLFRERLEILDLNNGTWWEGGSASGNSDRRSINLNTGVGEDLIKAGFVPEVLFTPPSTPFTNTYHLMRTFNHGITRCPNGHAPRMMTEGSFLLLLGTTLTSLILSKVFFLGMLFPSIQKD